MYTQNLPTTVASQTPRADTSACGCDSAAGVGALDFSSGGAFIQSLLSNPLYLLLLGGLGWWGYAKLTAAQEKAARRARKEAINELNQAYAAQRDAIDQQYPTRSRRKQE